jgi:hypothetical protein
MCAKEIEAIGFWLPASGRVRMSLIVCAIYSRIYFVVASRYLHSPTHHTRTHIQKPAASGSILF